MESLLSLSFDNIASKNDTKIRKGLRQIEGLLAQICLSKSAASSPSKRKSSVLPTTGSSPLPPAKKLGDLVEDPAFREFFRLQEGFEWNVATRLIACLERLMGMGSSGAHDLLILSTLDLLQGVLLLHPPSRALFIQEIYMDLLLDLLDPTNCPAIQSHTLLVLVTALLSTPANTRTFEAIDGLLTVTSLFKSRATSRDVKLKVVEFLYFYLMPETASTTSMSAPATAVLQRSQSQLGGALDRRTTHASEMGIGETEMESAAVRSTQEKQKLLGRYLSNVEELVQDLRENAPFGETVY